MTIYKIPGNSAGKTYHTDPDCRHIRAADRDPLPWSHESARRSRWTPCHTCVTGEALK